MSGQRTGDHSSYQRAEDVLLALVTTMSPQGFPLTPSWVRHRCLADLVTGRSWQTDGLGDLAASLRILPDARTGNRVVGLDDAMRRLCESGRATVLGHYLHKLSGDPARGDLAGVLSEADLRQVEQVVARWTAIAHRAVHAGSLAGTAGV